MNTGKQIMQKIIRILVLAVLCVGWALTIPQEAEAEEKRIVRVPCGINDMLYLDEEGKAKGYLSDYMEALADACGWELDYVDTEWAEAMEMLQDGRIDILFPTARTKEREATMEFSAIVAGYSASGLFALESSGYNYGNYAEFDGLRIAVTENSSNRTDLEAFAAQQGFSYEPVYLSTKEEKVEALYNGEVDLISFNASNTFPKGRLVGMMEGEPFYFAVKKGNGELLSEMNEGMGWLISSNSDLVGETYSGCLTGDNANVTAFTVEEQNWIDSGNSVTVGFYMDTEPLAYVDTNGNNCGIYQELLTVAADHTGLSILLYPISRKENWQDLLERGEIDFFVGSSQAGSEGDRFRCTNSFMDYKTVLITRHDYVQQEDSHPVMALTAGRIYWADHLPEDFAGAEVTYYETAKECLMAVKKGEADATLLNTLEYNYQSKNPGITDLVQWESYRFDSEIVMTARKDADEVMFSVVNKALDSLTDAEVDDIVNRSLNMPYDMTLMDMLYSNRFGLLVLLIVLVSVAAVTWNRKKRAEMARQNQEHEQRQLRVLAALSLDFVSVYYVNLDKDEFTIVKMTSQMRHDVEEMVKQIQVYSQVMQHYIDDFVAPEYQETLRAACSRDALLERFKEDKSFTIRYEVNKSEWNCRFFDMQFVDIGSDEEGRKMVMGYRCVDEIVQEEQKQKEALREAFEASNRANHAKSDFLSRMSHDIRTPMNAIIGMTAIAAVHIDDKEQVKDALGKITASSRHLLTLINEVLDMSKIESGKVSLTEEEFNLPDLICNLLSIVQPEIRLHNHQLKVHIMNLEHEDVVGDSLRIQQAFVNVMGNAVKYTPDHGEISLTVREKPVHKPRYGCYEFIFEDNGIGMTEEYLKHIFEPFSRAEDPRTSKIQGTGLGMPITWNIVRMMNGDIQVESEPGKGSKFTITIFLRLQEQEEENAEELAGLRVLVADDDQICCQTTCQMLEEIGMVGKWVLSGQEAVDEVKESLKEDWEFFAVILDWKMPGMDGLETARQIRRLVGPNVPVVILSAYEWSEIEMDARAAGVDLFLSKPIFKSSLLRLFRRIRNGEDEEEEKLALEEISERDYSGMRALLVEDNELNREIAAEILRLAGLETEVAENGKEAVDKFSASPVGYYDIIFMDVQMPVMNGYDATSAIRSLRRADAARVPVVAMTANAFVEDIQAAKSFGMNEHLAKPLDFGKLRDVLDKYLGHFTTPGERL